MSDDDGELVLGCCLVPPRVEAALRYLEVRRLSGESWRGDCEIDEHESAARIAALEAVRLYLMGEMEFDSSPCMARAIRHGDGERAASDGV